jgi:hypothetical protein
MTMRKNSERRPSAWTLTVLVICFLAGAIPARTFAQGQATITGSVHGRNVPTTPPTQVKAIPHGSNKLNAECEKGGVKCDDTAPGTGEFVIHAPRDMSYDIVACPATTSYMPQVLKQELRLKVDPERMDASVDVTPKSKVVQIETPNELPAACWKDDGRLFGGGCQTLRIVHNPTGCLVDLVRTDRQGRFSLPDDPSYTYLPSSDHNVPNRLLRMCDDGPPPPKRQMCAR